MSQVGEFFSVQYISRTGIIKVEINIRRKQLNTIGWIQVGYGSPAAEYYSKALKYFQDKYTSVCFIICSYDIKWVRTNIVGDNIIYFPDPRRSGFGYSGVMWSRDN